MGLAALRQADATPKPRRVLACRPGDDPGDGLARGQALEFGVPGAERRYRRLAGGLVVPATHHVDLGLLHRWLNRPFGLATEPELARLFEDCELGAIPPIGAAYGLETIFDDSLGERPDVYLEAGDHRTLIHVKGEDFVRLMAGTKHARISKPA